MKAGAQVLVRAAAGYLNSISIYQRFLASESRVERCRGLSIKARAIIAHDRLLAGESPRGSRA